MEISNTCRRFRGLYLIGLLLSFTSMFLDWYVYQVYDSGHNLKSYWSYNPLFGWATVFSKNSTVNNALKPNTFHIPPTLTFLFILMIVISAYIVIFRDVEQYQELEKLTIHAYTNLFLLMLMLYYIFGFPVFYLLPNDLYFPFLNVKDKDTGMVYQYSVGPGYVLNLLGFIFAFPYAMFYYYTVTGFRSEKSSAQDMVDSYIQRVQDPIDIDRLIANEQLKLKLNDISYDALQKIETRHKSTKKRMRS